MVPLVLEARGLDVTPAMIERLRAAGDTESVGVLDLIYARACRSSLRNHWRGAHSPRDEIGHVAIGRRWFEFVCARQGREPKAAYHDHVRDRFKGLIKPPFNTVQRDDGTAAGAAGLTAGYYRPLSRGAG